MKLNPKQIEAILALPGVQRYRHFIKQVADSEVVWGLYKDGWALASTNDEEEVFPVWPDKEYAMMCAKQEWQNYEPSSITLEDFINELLPKLEKDSVRIAVFYTPNDNGVLVEADKLADDISEELEKYS